MEKLATALKFDKDLVSSKSLNDFNENGTSAQFEKDKTYYLGDAMCIELNEKTSTGATHYSAFEVYTDAQMGKDSFIGYGSFNRMQGRKFVDITKSKAGKWYAKTEAQNTWNAPKGTTWGAISMKDKLSGKKVICTNVETQQQPIFNFQNDPSFVASDKSSAKLEPNSLFYLEFAK